MKLKNQKKTYLVSQKEKQRIRLFEKSFQQQNNADFRKA